MQHIVAFLLAQAALIATAVAPSATSTAGTAAPVADTGFNPLWLLIVLALIVAAVRPSMRRSTAAAATTTAPLQAGVYDRNKP